MSVSIMEGLMSADHNLQNNGIIGLMLAKEQLHNAVILLIKGYSLSDHVEPLLETTTDGKPESVSEKETT